MTMRMNISRASHLAPQVVSRQACVRRRGALATVVAPVERQEDRVRACEPRRHEVEVIGDRDTFARSPTHVPSILDTESLLDDTKNGRNPPVLGNAVREPGGDVLPGHHIPVLVNLLPRHVATATLGGDGGHRLALP